MTEKPVSKQTVLTGDALGILIVLGILIAANVVCSRIGGLRSDLTEENLYTLSGGTQGLLQDLPRPVALKFYFSRSNRETPVAMKQYGQRIQDLLKEYETHGKGNIILETYDPKPDTDEEEWAQKYGLVGQSINPLGGDPLYLGLVASSGAREAVLPFLAPNMEPQLEYLVTRLVSETTQDQKPKIGIMSSLPVMGMMPPPQMGMMMMPPQQGTPPWIFVNELQNLYEVSEVSPEEENIPEDIDTLLLIHPKNFSDKTLFGIDQFVMRGGRLMVFADPLCLTEQATSGQPPQMGGFGFASDLNRITKAWGLEMPAGKVVGDLVAATQVSSGRGGTVERSMTWLSLRGDQISRADTAMGSLEFVMAPMAGSFAGTPAEGVTMTPLLTSSSQSGTVDAFMAMDGGSRAAEALQRNNNMPIALRLQGKFKTAFPSGPPEDPNPPEEGGPGKDEPAPAFLKESPDNGVVVLVGDVDLLYDRFSVQTMNIMGQTVATPLNDNLNLVLNLTEQISGNEALIGLRSRGTYERPFTRVLELEREAQDQFQEQEQSLQAKLQETQSRLSSLQSAKQQDQQFILSKEQEAEIKKFQDDMFNTRKELKEVRKNLRRDIENLGMKLKILNIAAIPGLVAVFGMVRGVRRKKRASRHAA